MHFVVPKVILVGGGLTILALGSHAWHHTDGVTSLVALAAMGPACWALSRLVTATERRVLFEQTSTRHYKNGVDEFRAMRNALKPKPTTSRDKPAL